MRGLFAGRCLESLNMTGAGLGEPVAAPLAFQAYRSTTAVYGPE
jgi:hypothetical protein